MKTVFFVPGEEYDALDGAWSVIQWIGERNWIDGCVVRGGERSSTRDFYGERVEENADMLLNDETFI